MAATPDPAGGGDALNRSPGRPAQLSERYLLVLLVAVLLLLVVYPVSTLGRGATLAYSTAYVVLLVVGVRLAVSGTAGRWIVVTAVVTGLLLVPWALLDLLWLDLAAHASLAVFQALLVSVLLRYLFDQRRVHLPTLLAGVSTYLLLGNAFTPVHLIVDTVTVQATGSHAYVLPEAAAPTWQTMTYYSFATLTTLGFGDITPATETAQMVTVLEAAAGPVFLAVLVGRLVGLSATTVESESEED